MTPSRCNRTWANDGQLIHTPNLTPLTLAPVSPRYGRPLLRCFFFLYQERKKKKKTNDRARQIFEQGSPRELHVGEELVSCLFLIFIFIFILKDSLSNFLGWAH